MTGGSSGIGLAVAAELARRGAHVALLARDQGRLDAAAARRAGGAPFRQAEDHGGRLRCRGRRRGGPRDRRPRPRSGSARPRGEQRRLRLSRSRGQSRSFPLPGDGRDQPVRALQRDPGGAAPHEGRHDRQRGLGRRARRVLRRRGLLRHQVRRCRAFGGAAQRARPAGHPRRRAVPAEHGHPGARPREPDQAGRDSRRRRQRRHVPSRAGCPRSRARPAEGPLSDTLRIHEPADRSCAPARAAARVRVHGRRRGAGAQETKSPRRARDEPERDCRRAAARHRPAAGVRQVLQLHRGQRCARSGHLPVLPSDPGEPRALRRDGGQDPHHGGLEQLPGAGARPAGDRGGPQGDRRARDQLLGLALHQRHADPPRGAGEQARGLCRPRGGVVLYHRLPDEPRLDPGAGRQGRARGHRPVQPRLDRRRHPAQRRAQP